MYKIAFVLLLTFLMAEWAIAKVDFGLQIHGGLNMGRYKNYSFKNGKLSSMGGQLRYLYGGGGGIEGRLWLNRFAGISLGVEVNDGGNKRKETIRTGGTMVIQVDDRIKFLTIPLCVHAGYGNERMKIFATAGMYYSYAFYGRYKYKKVQNGILLADEKGELDFDNTYNRTDIGLRMGAGIEVFVSDNGKHGITFDLTYDWGLYPVFREDIQFQGTEYRFTHSRVSIQAGYIVRFGKQETSDDLPPLPEL